MPKYTIRNTWSHSSYGIKPRPGLAGCLAQGLPRLQSVSQTVFSTGGSTREKSAFKLTWHVGRIHFLSLVGQRTLAFCCHFSLWGLSSDATWFAATWPSPWQHVTRQLPFLRPVKEQERGVWKQMRCACNCEWLGLVTYQGWCSVMSWSGLGHPVLQRKHCSSTSLINSCMRPRLRGQLLRSCFMHQTTGCS